MHLISALIAGFIFGLGLILSGMTNPLKIQNFLDVFGSWDPSLAFVMAGAIAVTLPGYFLLKKRPGPVFGEQFKWPTKTALDPKLLSGAALFGVGWGIGGYCPGPALTSLPLAASGTLVFCATMLFGFSATKFFTMK